MSTTEIRSESHQLLDRIDERFLAAVHALLRTYEQEKIEDEGSDPVVSYDVVTGTPRTASELTEMLDSEVEAVRGGEFTTFDDFQKESAQWAQRSK